MTGFDDGGWNLATAWEAVAAELGDTPALAHGDLVRGWREFEDRSARLAGALAAAGVGRDSKIALYLYNGPTYLEATFAAFKLGAVPVNVNYRYTDSELLYLLDNADAEVVVASPELADRIDPLRPDLPRLRSVFVDDDTLEAIATGHDRAPVGERSLDDLWFLYTGGTTGMPKGVMWPHRSLFASAAVSFKGCHEPMPGGPDGCAVAARAIRDRGEAAVLLPAAPLMHGTSALSTWGVLTTGGTIVTLTSRSLDAEELLDAVETHGVTNLTLVGDAFAKPVVTALEKAEAAAHPRDLSSLKIIVSSGVMWSQPVKDALLARADVVLADLVGSSEGIGMANSVAKRGRPAPTARFRLGEHARVVTDDGRDVAPGSGEVGMLAVGGPIPIGYYKDPEKTAATFRRLDGRVWSIPGDHATVDADGMVNLLGRGSVCINTAGEKVYPEEVEEALKTHPEVHDANVVGLPDERWGQAVTAVVALEHGSSIGVDELRDHCRTTLAGYKVPKSIVMVPRVERSPNGKTDYRWAAKVAADAVAARSPHSG